MTHTMTSDEWHAFLSAGTRTAKLSTVSADGSPHVAPVWFVLDGDDIVFNTGADSVKGRNIARDPRIALCVDDERPPFAFAIVRGRAETSTDPDELRTWATRIAARYVGEDLAEQYGIRNSGVGEIVARLRVDRITAVGGVAD